MKHMIMHEIDHYWTGTKVRTWWMEQLKMNWIDCCLTRVGVLGENSGSFSTLLRSMPLPLFSIAALRRD